MIIVQINFLIGKDNNVFICTHILYMMWSPVLSSKTSLSKVTEIPHKSAQHCHYIQVQYRQVISHYYIFMVLLLPIVDKSHLPIKIWIQQEQIALNVWGLVGTIILGYISHFTHCNSVLVIYKPFNANLCLKLKSFWNQAIIWQYLPLWIAHSCPLLPQECYLWSRISRFNIKIYCYFTLSFFWTKCWFYHLFDCWHD